MLVVLSVSTTNTLTSGLGVPGCSWTKKPDGEDHAQRARFGSRVIGRVAREWVTHLRIGNGSGAWVLLVAKPGVLYVVHLGVVRLNVGEVLPTGRPPEALTRREHLLWKRERER